MSTCQGYKKISPQHIFLRIAMLVYYNEQVKNWVLITIFTLCCSTIFVGVPTLAFLVTSSAGFHVLVRWTDGCLLPYIPLLGTVFLATQKHFLVIQTHSAIEEWVT